MTLPKTVKQNLHRFFIRFFYCLLFWNRNKVQKLRWPRFWPFSTKFEVFPENLINYKSYRQTNVQIQFFSFETLTKLLTHPIFWKMKSWKFILHNWSDFSILSHAKIVYRFRSSDLKKLTRVKSFGFKSANRWTLCFSASFEGWDFEVLVHGEPEIKILEERSISKRIKVGPIWLAWVWGDCNGSF